MTEKKRKKTCALYFQSPSVTLTRLLLLLLATTTRALLPTFGWPHSNLWSRPETRPAHSRPMSPPQLPPILPNKWPNFLNIRLCPKQSAHQGTLSSQSLFVVLSGLSVRKTKKGGNAEARRRASIRECFQMLGRGCVVYRPHLQYELRGGDINLDRLQSSLTLPPHFSMTHDHST